LGRLEHRPGENGQKQVYPLVAEGINNGLFIPNRASTLCSYFPYKAECDAEFGGVVE